MTGGSGLFSLKLIRVDVYSYEHLGKKSPDETNKLLQASYL